MISINLLCDCTHKHVIAISEIWLAKDTPIRAHHYRNSQMHPTILSSNMEGTRRGLSFVPQGPTFTPILNGSCTRNHTLWIRCWYSCVNCCTTCTSCLPPNQPLKHLSPSSPDQWPAPHQWELCPLVEKHVCKQIHFNTDIEECYCHTTCCGSTCVVQCRGRTPD